MRKYILLLILAAVACSTLSGCSSDGSREFIPGKGWRKN